MLRYNPVTIKPAIKGELSMKRLYREMQLFDDIKINNNILKPTKKRLSKEIIKGVPLKSISKAENPHFQQNHQ